MLGGRLHSYSVHVCCCKEVKLIVEVGVEEGCYLLAIQSLAVDPEGRLHTACTALHAGSETALSPKGGKAVPQCPWPDRRPRYRATGTRAPRHQERPQTLHQVMPKRRLDSSAPSVRLQGPAGPGNSGRIIGPQHRTRANKAPSEDPGGQGNSFCLGLPRSEHAWICSWPVPINGNAL